MKRTKELFEEIQQELSDRLISIENGEENTALQMYHELNKAEKNIKEFKSQVQSYAFREISDGYELNGYDVKIKNGATRFVYKDIPSHIEAMKVVKEIEERSKQAYISMQKGMQVATDDGEEIELPNVLYNKDSISITLKK